MKKHLNRLGTVSSLIAWGFLCAALSVPANTCLTDAAEAGGRITPYLPKTMGEPGATKAKSPFQMPCDTMFVKPGDTTTVYHGSMLHFPPNKFENRIIHVQGVLKLMGDTALPVFLSGSIEMKNQISPLPGPEKWGGIRLDSGGALLVRSVDFSHADTAFDLRSPRYAFQNAFFKRCGRYVLPDGTEKVLDEGENLNVPDSMGIFDSKQRETFSWKPWVGWGAIALVGGAAITTAVLLWPDDSHGNSPTNPSGSAIKPLPAFPGKPAPR